MMIPEISFSVEAEWKNARRIGIGTAYCGTSGARLNLLMKTFIIPAIYFKNVTLQHSNDIYFLSKHI